MTLKLYLRLAIFLTTLDAVVLTYFYSANMGEDLIRPYLLAKVAVDALFVLGNPKLVRPSRFEVVLLAILVLHAIAGLVVLPMMDKSYVISRAINDIATPLLFILKVVVFRSLVEQGALSSKALRWLVTTLILLSAVQIAIFFVLGRSSGAYAGITPPVNLPMAYGLAFSQPWLIVISFLVIVLSGKRSFLLAALVAVLLRTAVQRGARVPFLVGGFLVIALLMMMGEETYRLLFEGISDKIQQSITIVDLAKIVASDGIGALFEDTVRHDLYMATAGRSEEVYAILSVMHWYNFFTGLGVGFTYSYLHWYGWVDGYANSHFSPLALTYKFGIIYTALIYLYIFRGMTKLLKSFDRTSSMVGVCLLMFMIESIFAFNLFVEMFLPLMVALRQVAESGIPDARATRPAIAVAPSKLTREVTVART